MVLKLYADRCIGCRLCQLACSAKKDEVFNPELARLKVVIIYEKIGIKIKSRICNMCLTCVEVCPTAAITHYANHLVYDQSKCTNCGMCIAECPAKVIAERENGVAICDLCQGSPACAEMCPHRALTNGEVI